MNDRTIARITGAFGLACVGLSFGQFPLWLVGSPPSVYDGRAFAQHLFTIKNVAFTRILMDQGIYISMLIFAADGSHPDTLHGELVHEVAGSHCDECAACA